MDTSINEQHVLFESQPMLTCLGNKRKLVKKISELIDTIATKIGKPSSQLNLMDAFTGSGVVSRMMFNKSATLITNDMENYSYLMSKCFFDVPPLYQQKSIQEHIHNMNHIAIYGPFIQDGIISSLYAPVNTSNIQEGERCFYTRENALIIDTLREYIEKMVEPENRVYCLVPLLIKASINANTAGVFKGFYKKGTVGHFGGAGENALSRIMKPIHLDVPIWCSSGTKHIAFNSDINSIPSETLKEYNLDIIYLDPPYNQHPYGSNYFMLNVIASNVKPANISKVSGIPVDWNKSNYNTRSNAVTAMTDLLDKYLNKGITKYVILSYNNEGIITIDDWTKIFEPYLVEKHEIKYDTYKGSRNLKDRTNKVIEIMYVIHKI